MALEYLHNLHFFLHNREGFCNGWFMFAHMLAVLLGVGSVGFYVAAFFYPEVHRRSDILLSGAGMLYAVLLWFCAGQMTWAVLLTQTVAIALLMVLGWQTLSVRREKTPVYQQTPVTITPELVGDWAKNTINQLRIAPADKVRPLRPQNPSLNGTSADRFQQPIDLRRRPVYDYEFVEDGVADDVPVEGSDDVSALVENVPDVVPPSAEAEVIEAEAQATGVEAEIEETELVQQVLEVREFAEQEQLITDETAAHREVAEEVDSKEIDVEEVDAEEVDSREIDTDEKRILVRDLSTDVPVEPSKKETSGKEMSVEESNDWNFIEDDFGDASVRSAAQDVSISRQTAPSESVQASDQATQHSNERASEKFSGRADLKTAEKPAVWAVPIILVGWIKDVVLSMTKPKPSKPIIEIPRRDSVSVARVDEATVRVEELVESDVVEDSAMADSNEANFDDRDEDNFDWIDQLEDMPESALENTAEISASASVNESIEESNWDD